MPASTKFTVTRVARYVLPFVRPLILGLLDPNGVTLKELVNAGLDLFDEGMAKKIKECLKSEPNAASGLIDEHLVRHTGVVLGTLVKRYAKQEAVKEHQADLLKLAKVTPEAWVEFLASDKLKMPALRQNALNSQLSAALNPQSTAPVFDPAAFVEFFRWLAVQNNLLGPLKPGLATALTKWITLHLNAQLINDLCRETPQANEAFKESVLRFLTSVHREAAEAHREAKGAHLTSKATLDVVRKIDKNVESLNNNAADARLASYKRSLFRAFCAYQELALDNYVAADHTCPNIWDIFVHPSCSKEHLRPEDMDAAQMESPPRLPATDLLPLLTQDDHRRTVLMADPGMGKSTLIQSLIAHLASGRLLAGASALGGLLPVPLILRDLVPLLPQDQVEAWTWDSLLTILLEHYQREETAPPLCEAYKGHEAEFREIIHNSERVFYLIDGLDEIGDLVKRRKIVQCIKEGIRGANKNARWLITSRVIGYNEAPVNDLLFQMLGKLAEFRNEYEKERHVNSGVNAKLRWQLNQIAESLQKWQPYLISRNNHAFLANIISEIQPRAGLNLSQLNGIYRRLQQSSSDELMIARHLYLAPFDDHRQDDFSSRWFRHRHSTDHSGELMREVRAHHHDGVRIISRVPNLLCMMNMLKRSGKPLPDGRAALYDEIVKAYLGGIDSAYKFKPILGNTCPFETMERRHLLSLLGAHMQQQRTIVENKKDGKGEPITENDSILISVPELQTLLIPAIEGMQNTGKVKGSHTAAKLLDELLYHIASRSGLLIPRCMDAAGSTVYGFTHLSFLEFFAAEWLGKEFTRARNRNARRTEAADDGQNITEVDLDQEYPPLGPIEHQRADFPGLAASPAWHEPLVFLLESRKSDTNTLLRWLFPALDVTSSKHGTSNVNSDMPLLPIEAVKLAILLAHDQELAISPATRQSWWRTLWAAYLEWPHPPFDGMNWPIPPLLLERMVDHSEEIQALVAVFPRSSDCGSPLEIPPLYIYECPNLTSNDIVHLTELVWLEKLDLLGCTGLKKLPDLSAMVGLRSLGLSFCDGFQGVDALSGLTRLVDLETLCLACCNGLEKLPDLGAMRRLRELDLRCCTGLRGTDALLGLASLPKLESLDLFACSGLEGLPNLSALRALRMLNLHGCMALKDLEKLQSQLPPDCEIIAPNGKRL